jgi:hypothetical protein
VRQSARAPDEVSGCFTEASALAHLDAGHVGVSFPDRLAHIEDCSRCRILIAEAARALMPGTSAARATFGAGSRVAERYQIVRYVARGGMGEVYEAVDLELGTTVALKTLLITALDDARAASRLKTEVILARKVTHPNVCRILEFGICRPADPQEPPIPFLTMPFLDGETLERQLAGGGPIRGPRLHSLVLDIAAGLEAIHAAGVVHRDLKTSNVFVVQRPAGGEQALVMDFGLARASAATSVAGAGASGTIAGTLHYMAPEQLAGAAPTPAMDMYALGVVIFEMLTGRKPFEMRPGEPGGGAPLLRGGPVPRPSRLSANVDRLWDTVVTRCLAPDPRRRLSGPGELRALLTAPPPWHAPRRRRALLLGGAALLVAGVAVGQRPVLERRSPRAAPSPAAPAASAASAAATTDTTTAAVSPAPVPPSASPAADPRPTPRPDLRSPGRRRRGPVRSAATWRADTRRTALDGSAKGAAPAAAAPAPSPGAEAAPGPGGLDDLANAFPDR